MKRKQRTNAQPVRTHTKLRRSAWIVVTLGAATGVAILAVFHSSSPWSASKVEASQQATQVAEPAAFGPTIPNTIAAPAAPSDGTVWISGGEFSMGAMDPPAIGQVGMHSAADARPIHRVYVDGFWMDKTDV